MKESLPSIFHQRSKTLLLLLLMFFIFLSTATVDAAKITNLRSHQGPEFFRMVFDVDEPIQYTEKKNTDQTEVIFFLPGNVTIKGGIPKVTPDKFYAESVSIEKKSDGLEVRVRFSSASTWKILSLKSPNRFVLDLTGPQEIERTTEISKGVQYRYHQFLLNGKPVRVHVVEIQKGAAQVVPVLAQNQLGKRETVSGISKRYGAIAAVNGGYFSNTGDYLGNLKLNGEWVVGNPQERTAWGFTTKGPSIVDTIGYRSKFSVESLTNWSIWLDGLNIPRGNDQVVLYTPKNGQTTRSNPWGKELIIEKGKIIGLSEGNTTIHQKEMVLSAHGKERELIDYLVPGEKVKLEVLVDSKWDTATHILGAGPRLVNEGKIHVTAKEESFPADIRVGRAPRTAIGEMKDGTIWLIIVDGRSVSSIGMTLEELAGYLVERNIYHAMNLDGGGSSTMVIQGTIKNNPSDGRERSVGSGIVVIPKK